MYVYDFTCKRGSTGLTLCDPSWNGACVVWRGSVSKYREVTVYIVHESTSEVDLCVSM